MPSEEQLATHQHASFPPPSLSLKTLAPTSSTNQTIVKGGGVGVAGNELDVHSRHSDFQQSVFHPPARQFIVQTWMSGCTRDYNCELLITSVVGDAHLFIPQLSQTKSGASLVKDITNRERGNKRKRRN